jgi:hypothetical protein
MAVPKRTGERRSAKELLAAMLQAEQSKPSVRTAALLRIARVLAKSDQGEAERLLDRVGAARRAA